MSNEAVALQAESSGFPELTELGKQLEMLRIGRGLSKQHLARVAGTSRQQLWRVMTGKSELTAALRQRLADVLRVEAGALSLATRGVVWSSAPTPSESRIGSIAAKRSTPAVTLDAYLGDAVQLERTLRSLPAGDSGRELKRALLNALEDQAVAHHVTLGAAFFDVRRRVLSGEL